MFAAMEGWDYPAPRSELLLADLFDLEVMVNTDGRRGRPKPHPMRPFKPETSSDRSRKGDAGGRSPAEVIDLLARMKAGELPAAT